MNNTIISASNIKVSAEHHPHHSSTKKQDLKNGDEPTVVDARPFDPRRDAEILYESMKGLGTHEDIIIDVLAKRTSKQRQDIAFFYKEQYGKDIVKAFKGELKILLSGHFDDVLTALFKAPSDYDAELIHHAITGISTDSDALIDIVCSRTNSDLDGIKSAYRAHYGKELVQDIEGHVHSSSNFKRILVAILSSPRDIEEQVNDKQARWDARALLDTGPKNWSKDTTLIPIFASRSYPHLDITISEFETLADAPIENVLGHDLHGDTSKLLQHIIRLAKNKNLYFADVLHEALSGITTHHKVLIRTIVSRSERDLGSIKKQFNKKYSKTLASFIEADTHGAYRSILLALSGYPPPS